MIGTRAWLAALLCLAAPAAAQDARPVAPGVWLIAGGYEAGKQPDGNSVIFESDDALLLVDTGRHASHAAKIEAAIAALNKPLVQIVNTHWHLDHVSGNLALKAKNPKVRVSASDAIDGALTGFLQRSADSARAALDAGKIPEPMASEVRGDLATFTRGQELRPDDVITRSGTITALRKPIEIKLARGAATGRDVWLYDPGTRVLIAGDLVTMPVPFLDTACPDGWRKALDQVAAVPFVTLVPGHGSPMTRAGFESWRRAFGAFLDCARSDRLASACATGWHDPLSHVLSAAEQVRTLSMATYYVTRIRGGELDRNCAA
ncbi:MBL fold metallo-hydrolase [Sphingomonas sp. MG17]|uniref:MBL fold metallo-hydrolase n=1 Tax=Sphingomonas tagetis TaxID=2949092 RepID=A0A9X2KKA7_9SPHN|nr:MBL fold metallo-hydrolase [Sphingomonas tagetis]MCP3729402.1 MBL fold metallo-hydrolase [Sphingomonas tagetis]